MGANEKFSNFSKDELLSHIQNLMDSGQGDIGRLRYILMTMRKGRPLYNSDQKYLEKKLDTKFMVITNPKYFTKAESKHLESINELIKLGVGDTGRLKFIYEALQRGKALYNSDQKYLEEKLQQINQSITTKNKSIEESIKSKSSNDLTLKLELANKKIISLEEIIAKTQNELKLIRQNTNSTSNIQTIKKIKGIMPKGWKLQYEYESIKDKFEDHKKDLSKVSEKIKLEQKKLSEQKRITKQIEKQNSKLTQLIINRTQYNEQVEIEKARLEEQILLEHKKVELQTKLAELITRQKIELNKAKEEKNNIIKQIHDKQILFSNEIMKEKQDLEKVKHEYDKIEKQAQIEKNTVSKKIEEEKSQLTICSNTKN